MIVTTVEWLRPNSSKGKATTNASHARAAGELDGVWTELLRAKFKYKCTFNVN